MVNVFWVPGEGVMPNHEASVTYADKMPKLSSAASSWRNVSTPSNRHDGGLALHGSGLGQVGNRITDIMSLGNQRYVYKY